MDAILCALDLSPTSKRVVTWAALFASRLDCRLTLFHAIHVPSDPWHSSMESERGAAMLHRRKQIHADMAQWIQSANVSWHSEIVVGDPAEMVAQHCSRHPVRWVVTGSKGFKGVKRLFLGTVVERMARMLPCPMLVIRPDLPANTDVSSIAVCCDRNFSGQRLAEYGSVLADLLNADLHLLHAMGSAADPAFMDPAEAPYGQAQQELQSRIKQHLLAIVPMDLQSRVRVETHLCAGQAQDQLPLMLGDRPQTLLLAGVRRRRLLGQWMTGSTTEALLRRAPCHVLIVPDDCRMVDAPAPADMASRSSQLVRTGIVRDPVFLAHRPPDGHHESHRRLEPLYALLDALGKNGPALIQPRAAGVDDLIRVHTREYVNKIAQTAQQDYSQVSADTYACADSYAAACIAAGGVMSAIDAVLKGGIRNAFVLERPPGHHAEISRASGFCLFNNVAIGARYARSVKGLRKVLIIDWDLHHGNGIQHVFEEDASVLYISTHQYPCFPGTGHYLESGRGQGQGYTINLPLGKRWRDGDFVALYQRLVVPVSLAFNPDLILVSAGFDIHKKDPLGSMRVTEEGFAAMTRIMMNVARKCCHDRLVLVLEGGYHPNAMASSIHAVLSELMGSTHADLDRLTAKARGRRVDRVINRCAHVVGHVWTDIGQ
jgi:acetoin utilization deacetylase AcuC-like enzyme/nucleotide-binding universal stress UspA family protein